MINFGMILAHSHLRIDVHQAAVKGHSQIITQLHNHDPLPHHYSGRILRPGRSGLITKLRKIPPYKRKTNSRLRDFIYLPGLVVA